MSNFIHPTALIDPKAQIGENNHIGPFCWIGPQAVIGDNNRLEGYVTIGSPAEHRDYFRKDPGPVKVGNNNVIREYVTLSGGTVSATTVGNDCTILRGCYLGHDGVIRNKAILSCNVLIGGHTIIGEGANLGMGSAIHQLRAIGAYSMIGMSSTVTRNISPFTIAFGTPCELQRINRIGLQRSGVSDADLLLFEDWFHQVKDQYEVLDSIAHLYQRYVNDFMADCRQFKPPMQKAA